MGRIVACPPVVRRAATRVMSSGDGLMGWSASHRSSDPTCTDDIEVVAEAGDGDAAVTLTQAHHPDVVLMDLRMPRVDGIRATALVRALPDAPGVIAMTSFDTESVILEAVHAGAAGFLAKDSAPADIEAAV